MLKNYPTIKWIKSNLRNNVIYPCRREIVNAYIVGSEAKCNSTASSDIDIAIIIEPIRNKTSIKITEEYHAKFTNDQFKPSWENRIVDIQFFYPEDQELLDYKKIQLL